MIRLTLLATPLLLAACAPMPDMAESNAAGVAVDNMVSVETPANCSVEGLGDLIGRARGPEVGNEAKQRSGARALRWIAPDTIVTMDYREDRLNLYTDADGRIAEARCG